MAWFWFWVVVVVLAIVGASILIGKAISGGPGRGLDRQDKINALKASGALRHRKSGRD